MAIIKTTEHVAHPEGCILLRDGSVIKGYAPRLIMEATDNSLRLDTTGVYLSLRKQRQTEKSSAGAAGNENKAKCNEEIMAFLRNAWYFYEHYQEVCADSRKFLARLPVQNNLAYSGTSGFRNPTLGVYVEWWHSCDSALVELNGEKWLVWHIAGSPLSGMNTCSIVNAEGKTQNHSIRPFCPVWSSFMQINMRYDECKTKYMAYTIEEVVALMRGDFDEREKGVHERTP